MGHQVEHAVALQHPLARCDRDVIAGLDADRGINLEVRIDDDHVAHLAGSHIVNVADARCLDQRSTYRLDLGLIGRAVHQIVQRIPAKRPAHPGDHEADDQRSDRVQDGVARQVADNADAHHSDEAASDRACQALATSMLDLTRLAAASM